MKKVKPALLLHPVFIISLAILLLNDFYWKYAYGNWLTGKLSDFAGMIVLPIFLTALFPRFSKSGVVIFSVLFFVWWKSPLSQPLLDFFKTFLQISLHRTIDYSDLLALITLPLLFKMQPWQYGVNQRWQKSISYLSGSVAFFALCATSPARHLPYSRYSQNEVRFDLELCSAKTADEVLQELRNKNIAFSQEQVRYYPLSPFYRDLFYRVPVNDTTEKWTPISFTPDSLVYVQERLYQPNYLISSYKFDEEILKNIRFRVVTADNKKKRSCVLILSFESDTREYEFSPNRKQKKKLNNYFSRLFNLQ
jgi:hypothetical protein